MIKLRFFLTIIFILLQTIPLYPFKIGITSIPKCGTYLMVKCIELLRQKKGINIDGTPQRELQKITKNDFFYCHLAYSKDFEQKLKKDNFKLFFIYRDPRDQIVSHAFWMKKLYKAYKDYPIEQLITLLIKSINLLYPKYLQWLDSEIVCAVKFESIIGPKGGGNILFQKKEINKISKKLEINSKDIKDHCITNLFGSSPTFREGKIGSWKQYFTNQQKKLFKDIANNLLIKLGYEKDLNW